jgi:hypothetical protein
LASAESTRQPGTMADFSNNTDTSLFAASSKEHTLFAGTLRNWGDPLLQGHELTPVPLCPRCAVCKCESLKAVPCSSAGRQHRHHRQRYHDHSCPNFRQHERVKTNSKPRSTTRGKRRANSYDPSLSSDHPLPLSRQDTDPSLSTSPIPLIKQRNSTSKIPVRIRTFSFTMTTTTSTASEYSPASSVHDSHSSCPPTRLPKPLVQLNSSVPTVVPNPDQTILSSSDEDFNGYDRDR